MGIFEKIVDYTNEQTDFTNDAAETAVKNRDAKLIELQRAALELEGDLGGLSQEDADTLAIGVADLAAEFGKNYSKLTAAQKEKLKATAAKVIGGENEVKLERVFNAVLDLSAASAELNTTMDALLAATPPTDPGEGGDEPGTGDGGDTDPDDEDGEDDGTNTGGGAGFRSNRPPSNTRR